MGGESSRQTDRQTDEDFYGQAYKQTVEQADVDRQKDGLTHTHRQTHTYVHTHRHQIHTETDRRTDGRTDRQTAQDKHTDEHLAKPTRGNSGTGHKRRKKVRRTDKNKMTVLGSLSWYEEKMRLFLNFFFVIQFRISDLPSNFQTNEPWSNIQNSFDLVVTQHTAHL